MKKFIATLVAAAVVSFGIINVSDSGAPTAEATFGDTRSCVTVREAKAIRLFMPQRQVFRILDGRGKRIGAGPNWVDRQYKFCRTNDPLIVEFVRGRVAGLQAWS